MAGDDPLRVLKAARLFGEQCIDLAQGLPRRAPARLRTQLAEAGQAVSDILAEGIGRGTKREQIHYCRMARGSLEECQNYLRRCMNRQLIDAKSFYKSWNLSVVIGRMLDGYIAHLERHRDEN
jgi:four helix bundle protein